MDIWTLPFDQSFCGKKGGMHVIEAKNVDLKYPDGTVALKDVNLEIEAGDLVYIIGPSGSGKTSLLKLLMGMEYPTGGKLTVLGQPMKRRYSSRRINRIRQKMGPVFQEFKLIEGRTALENVVIGMRFLRIPPKKMRDTAKDALAKVGLSHKETARVERLSWGEAQRVAIARAVARKPKLIIADEPTGNLDHENAMKILELLKSFRDEDTAVIITTHATHLLENEEDALFVVVNAGTIQVERRNI